jgi:hypothetical protein
MALHHRLLGRARARLANCPRIVRQAAVQGTKMNEAGAGAGIMAR